MSRKASERKQVRVVERTQADLRAERDALLAKLDGCRNEDCPCHGFDLIALRDAQFLLGEDDPLTDDGETR